MHQSNLNYQNSIKQEIDIDGLILSENSAEIKKILLLRENDSITSSLRWFILFELVIIYFFYYLNRLFKLRSITLLIIKAIQSFGL